MYDALHFQTEKNKEKLKDSERNWKFLFEYHLTSCPEKIWCSHYFVNGADLQQLPMVQPKLKAFL